MQHRKGHGTSGLSHLADMANPVDHYPVKRRREPRRLDPNWTGIAWLEAQSLEDVEIIYKDGITQGDTGLRNFRASGWYGVRRRGGYPGPMFKIVQDQPLDPGCVVSEDPCPDCDDFSRTSRCATHPEKRAEEWIISQMPLPAPAPADRYVAERLSPTPGTVRTAPLGTLLDRFIAEQQEHGAEVRRRLAGRHQVVLDGVEVTYEEARDA